LAIHERRLLRWEGCPNARDLGGYPTEDGRETGWGEILRSDNTHGLTENGRKALLESRVRTIIDVRRTFEVAGWPSPFASHPDVMYHHISFEDEGQPEIANDVPLAEMYLRMLKRDRAGVAAILTAIAQAPSGPVLFHCHAGKDRTGMIAALLLRLAGVPIEVAAEDYALTLETLHERDQEWVAGATTPEERAQRLRDLERWSSTTHVMERVLSTIDEEYGSAEGYMQWVGVEDENIRMLRERLLDDSTPPA
jgi:protein-tyrosine phosphatase